MDRATLMTIVEAVHLLLCCEYARARHGREDEKEAVSEMLDAVSGVLAEIRADREEAA